jgi:hypothetical protein
VLGIIDLLKSAFLSASTSMFATKRYFGLIGMSTCLALSCACVTPGHGSCYRRLRAVAMLPSGGTARVRHVSMRCGCRLAARGTFPNGVASSSRR